MSALRELGNRRFGNGDSGIIIGLYACRAAWVFVTAALLAWSVWGMLNTGTISAAFIIFVASQVVYWLSFLYYRRRLNG